MKRIHKPKLLIINKAPFGMHVDTYKYCQYLRDRYDITYICLFPSKSKKEALDGVKVVYTPSNCPKLLRGILFIVICLLKGLFYKGKIFVVCYPEYAGIIKKMLLWRKMILDIRTLSISADTIIREKHDKEVIKICGIYEHVSVISEGIRDKIGIDETKSSILPLGADIVSNTNKTFDNGNLLYVGSLNGRDIEKTIYGFNLFCKKYPDNRFTYDMIGDGYNNEKEKLNILITEYSLSNKIKLHGRIPNTQLKPFLDKCNIGVAFVPQTSYFDYQPSTKVFEYVLSGLFCIATSTYSNRELINDDNGTLIQDTAEAFAEALENIYLNKYSMDSNSIRNTLMDYTWEKIVSDKLIPILNKI
jgi:glycosyltransferase involved in cell wall biosynthesis